MRTLVLALVAGLGFCSTVHAALSGNLIQNGDFETVGNLKNSGSLDANNTFIPVHRFNQDADLGLWLAQYGPPSLGGLGGFSTYDDPRDLAETGGDTQASGDLGSMNRSSDPTDLSGANHVLEGLLFYTRAAQWFEAPAGNVPGAFHLEFDFYLNRWDPPGGESSNPGASTNFEIGFFGTNELPPHDVGYVGEGIAVNPRGAIEAGTLDGDLIARFNWGDWWDWPNTPVAAGNNNGWMHISTDDLTNWNFDPNNGETTQDGKDDVLNELTQTYPYYVVAVRMFTYYEAHQYFWLYGGKITDVPAIMVDNIVLQMSVADAYLPGDFDGSGTVDTQDINPFIMALTNPGSFQSTYGVDPAVYDTNNDGVINTEDINPFIAILTGAGQSAIIPEPATFGLLALGGLAMARGRRDCGAKLHAGALR